MRLKLLKRIGIALVIGFGPLAAALALFLARFMPGDANGVAGFYLGATLVVTPFSLFAGGVFGYSDRK